MKYHCTEVNTDCYFYISRAMGLHSTPNLSSHVHQSVGGAATLTGKAIDLYGVSVEQLLIKHGKSIIGLYPDKNPRIHLYSRSRNHIKPYRSPIILITVLSNTYHTSILSISMYNHNVIIFIS